MNDVTHLASLPSGPQSSSCWTCKARRKKCDGGSSVCNACKDLHLTCYNGSERPEWMDGGPRQEGMARKFKTMVKQNAHRRRAERSVTANSDRGSPSAAGCWIVIPQGPTSADHPTPSHPAALAQFADAAGANHELSSQAATASTRLTSDHVFHNIAGHDSLSFGRDGTVLITFYLESLFPFLFPFHQPSTLQGGRAWILELLLKSPVVRQATLCQSSFFFSLVQGTAKQPCSWNLVLHQTREAFQVLRQALQVINEQDITEHLHGAVRILASIVQLQRFEVAVMSFDNCRAHLNAGVSLFRQLLNSGGVTIDDSTCPSSCFDAVIERLRLSSSISPYSSDPVPVAEQAAFQFSCTILIFDDIIASTVLQEQPQLYDLHRGLLIDEAPIDLESAVGCQNWVLLLIGEIAALDAWKQQCKRGGNLDMMELVRRATIIKSSIEADFLRLEATPATPTREGNAWAEYHLTPPGVSAVSSQSKLMTRIWAHAAKVYLSVVVSGWQPAGDEVRYHVQASIDLFSQISPPALLRAVCWPFCVVGCLAETGYESQLRRLVQSLQPSKMFGTLYKALEIMETAWHNRTSIAADHDLAACFRMKDEMVLLV